MTVKRQPNWRQPNPRDQLVAMIGSIQGNVSNMEDGIGKPEEQFARIRRDIRDCMAILQEMPEGEFSTDDRHLGKFVYCKQHVRPHSTGWCTVGAYDKVPLTAETEVDAIAECRERGLKIYGEDVSAPLKKT